MECPRCLNKDKRYFYHGSKGWYCRKCISFSRMLLEEEIHPVSLEEIKEGSQEYQLTYPLTPAQKKISDECANTIEHHDVLLHCVCGAGKTELVVESIAKMLEKKKKVCFAIPRRQVVLELHHRLKKYFPKAKVIAVCAGHTKDLDGDLIICTTHQLYRYYQAFDLLILDEPDAFPFRGNDVLHGIAKTACKKRMIYLTATIDATLKQAKEKGEIITLELYVRPHGKPLPVPKIIISPRLVLYGVLWWWIEKMKEERCMIFVPTISLANSMAKIISIFYPNVFCCTSQSENRDESVMKFRNLKKGIMVCTTILERGVTIEKAHILVFLANHLVFDEASLTQIAGRAGRSYAYPYGTVTFLCDQKSRLVYDCKESIEGSNRCAV